MSATQPAPDSTPCTTQGDFASAPTSAAVIEQKFSSLEAESERRVQAAAACSAHTVEQLPSSLSHIFAHPEADSERRTEVSPAEYVPIPAPTCADLERSRAEMIEQIFSKLEAESARRAEAEAVAERQATIRERDRRRGSITISRYGQGQSVAQAPPAAEGSAPADPLRTPVATAAELSRTPSFGARKSAFYKVRTGPPSPTTSPSRPPSSAYAHAGSVDSFASASDPPLPAHEEEAGEVQVTQVATIVGKPGLSMSIGRAIARRLSLTKSAPATPAPAVSVFAPQPLVIGVSVQSTSTTVSVHTASGPDAADCGAARAVEGARGAEKTVTSSAVVYAEKERERERGEEGWRGKARDLTQRFRRRSSAALLQNVQVLTAAAQ